MYAIEAAPGPGRASMAGDPPQTMQRQINYRAAGYEHDTEVSVDLAELAKALDTFAKGARRLVAPTEDQERVARVGGVLSIRHEAPHSL